MSYTCLSKKESERGVINFSGSSSAFVSEQLNKAAFLVRADSTGEKGVNLDQKNSIAIVSINSDSGHLLYRLSI